MSGGRPPFPFFVGCGRSGTTLFRMIFDSHLELAIPDESNFVVPLARQRAAYERSGRFDAERFLADLALQRSVRRWGIGAADLRESFVARPPDGYADAVREVFAAYARRRGKPRYGDKTPRYVMDLPLLAGLFPEARFVHVLRDGRDVALSFLDVDFGPATVGEAALAWRERVEAGRAAAPALVDRYTEVRYEDLLDDPEGVTAALCSFLGLTFDPAMLRYSERPDLGATTQLWKYRHVGEPPTHGMRDWRTQMAPDDVELFEALAGDVLDALGYERAVPRPSASARARAAGVRLSRRARSSAREGYRSARASGGTGSGSPTSAGGERDMIAEPRLERDEVLSWVLARRADADPGVRSFREEVLGDARLTLDDVADWLATNAGTAALGRLRGLAAELAGTYPWTPDRALAYVLTGLAPRVDPVRIRIEGGHPIGASTRIVMEIDPAIEPGEVARRYERTRRQMVPARLRQPDERALALALHAAEHPDADPGASLQAWNRAHPSMAYADARRFERELALARRRLLDPPW